MEKEIFKLNIRKEMLIIVLLLSLLIFSNSLYNLISWQIDNRNTKKQVTFIDENFSLEEVVNEEKPSLMYTADFTNLKKINNEVVAFIKVNGTSISYPVVQAKDNEFYLNRSFNKRKNSAGWIFMDYRNTLEDRNIIIYGHGRMDNTMFGSLRSLLTKSWFNSKNNHYLNLITEENSYLYQIFSVYNIKRNSNEHIKVNFNNDDLFKLFITEIEIRSNFKFDLEVSYTDKIITLSTCRNDKEFVVVHAKLIEKVDF